MDIIQALLQDLREHRKDMAALRQDLASLRERSARERERTANRLSNIDRTLREMQVQMAKPPEFTFKALHNQLFLKVGFGIGMTIASLRLPEEAATKLIEVVSSIASLLG